MRERGYRPVQMWVPDVRSAQFAPEAHREALALAEADRYSDDMESVEAISEDLASLRRVNRGELWTVSGGVYAAKPRTAIIVQDDLFAATESVVVIPVTTTPVAGVAIARIAVPTTTGIAQPSFAMVDKITTVRRSNLGTRIGRVSATLMADIERSLMEAVEKHRHHAFAGRPGYEGAAELAIRGIMLASNQVQINWAHVSV